MNPLQYGISYESAVVGFEFEFFSRLPREQIARDLGSILKKQIQVRRAYHSKTQKGVWKIEPDFSGGVLMHELVTPPMPYNEAMLCLSRILGWMRGTCWTDEKCAFQYSVSYDKMKSKLITPIEGINKLKFILGFDEDFVYERFPKRKNSAYARSISTIIPNNKFQSSFDTALNPANYELPNDKFYGVNFTKLGQGYIEFRYLGGKSYEKKPSEIREVIEYSVNYLYEVLKNNNNYTANEVSRLKIEMVKQKKVSNSFGDPERFLKEYPNIKVFCDLRGDIQTIQTFWVHIREKLFDLIVRCGVRSGMFNYDPDSGKFQLKEAFIPTAFSLVDWELIDCRIRGNMVKCDLYHCQITNGHLMDCNVLYGTEISNSKVQSSSIHTGVTVMDSYIDNKDQIISGRIERCVVRSGDVTDQADIIECELIYKLLGLAKNDPKTSTDPKDAKNYAPEYWDKMSGDKKGDKKMGQVLAGYIGGEVIPIEKGDEKKSVGKVLEIPGVEIPIEKTKGKK